MMISWVLVSKQIQHIHTNIPLTLPMMITSCILAFSQLYSVSAKGIFRNSASVTLVSVETTTAPNHTISANSSLIINSSSEESSFLVSALPEISELGEDLNTSSHTSAVQAHKELEKALLDIRNAVMDKSDAHSSISSYDVLIFATAIILSFALLR